ncbi:MAG: class I SAM-dependent methyltransferase [Gemmataceae bacterium]
MSDLTFGQLRIYDGYREQGPRGPTTPVDEPCPDDLLSLQNLGQLLAVQETLRPLRIDHDSPEPLSLQWYLAIERIRHQRQGRWLCPLLEFSKHQGEKLLGLGTALGSDLVHYAAAGADVTTVCGYLGQLSLIQRNFQLRGLSGTFIHADPKALPLETSSIDVVCLTGLLHEPGQPSAIIDEVYRVLKPGGKVLAVVPAHYDVHYWSRILLLSGRDSNATTGEEASEPPIRWGMLSGPSRRFCARDLRTLFARFPEYRISKRHLRRAEVPHLWRWIPVPLLERLMGRLLVFKGFKPVSAARVELAAA